ncbi:dipeptide ABC transporter ATP-binding protein [Protaetiibacter intestinalis]|uniref:ABC transporter ATP-binding protein n=1 Tax=Protaetiibacter intestinalis TaxID=2419774 RepID=A0A387BAM3_9MICO|nr:ABC transporter ATP-binding protein [Protaetiibacter intestinalis]AYF98186.1 ABC transporter ATP-binding protein [Protaetiibacter intestinalis]
MSAIELDHVTIGYRRTPRADVEAVVHGVSLALEPAKTLALVGQSGSGKSTIAHAVAGLLPAVGSITAGSIRVDGHDVTRFGRRDWRPLRGRTIGFVPQDPLSSLDPLQRIGRQLGSVLRLHRDLPPGEVQREVVSLLDRVGIREPEKKVRAYPHELSGGQLQRVLIAGAVAGTPRVLIADEPTSALDVTVQRRILDLLGELQDELGLSILFITHDLALAFERSDDVAVLNHGRLREHGPAVAVLGNPRDPYTVRLLADAPSLSPDRYLDRTRPAVRPEPIVEVAGLTKRFDRNETLALDAVSLQLRGGSVHALVGESGSGKTTLARIVAGLTGFDAGTVTVDGVALPTEPRATNPFARRLQLVYQNPLAAVDPRYPIERIIEEPLRIHGIGDRAARQTAVREILDRVALPASVLGRRAREVSGGQRQRVAVARALVLAPDVLVLDEPTSALDVTVQAQIIELLLSLQAEQGLSYLFISHDLSLVRQIADEVTVLQHGRVVEHGNARTVFDHPRDPYTADLVDSIPGRERHELLLA